MKPQFKLTLIIVSMLVSVGSVVADPIAQYRGQATVVTLSAESAAALTSLGISATALPDAKVNFPKVRFPAPFAELDLATAEGEIVHTGGLRLKKGNKLLTVSNFIIDTSNAANPVLTAAANLNGNTLGRLSLFKLQLPALTLPLARNKKLNLAGVGVRLSADGASALNTAFSTTAFVADFNIGSAQTVLNKPVRLITSNLGGQDSEGQGPLTCPSDTIPLNVPQGDRVPTVYGARAPGGAPFSIREGETVRYCFIVPTAKKRITMWGVRKCNNSNFLYDVIPPNGATYSNGQLLPRLEGRSSMSGYGSLTAPAGFTPAGVYIMEFKGGTPPGPGYGCSSSTANNYEATWWAE